MDKKENIYILGHKNPDTDSIISAIAYAQFKNLYLQYDSNKNYNFIAARCGCLQNQTKFILEYLNIPSPILLKDMNTINNKYPIKLILVDHNEYAQCIDGINKAEIIEIIDHHRLNNSSTSVPIRFINEPCGSTCTIISSIYKIYDIKPELNIAKGLAAGIISDTLYLKSPTTTSLDINILQWLKDITKMNFDIFAKEIFQHSSIILFESPMNIIQYDCKIYCEENKNFSISQLEELNFNNFFIKKNEIINHLEVFRQKSKLDYSFLVITDINKKHSLLIFNSKNKIRKINKLRNFMDYKNIFILENMISRKKQIFPYILELIKN